MLKRQFQMLADYNRWVNERLFAAAARLSDADYRADHGVFFGSLHGTLNHLLLGDRIWLYRFTGEGEEPKELDAILHEDLPSLRRARAVEDERIIAYIAGLDEARLAGTIRYRTTRNPIEIEQELVPLLLHFFNHQTHHRGQAHVILTRIAGEAPSFDLLMYQRETGRSIVAGAGGSFAATEKRPSR
jgi:uncharacterized damage-inducible protein DinB